MLGLLVGNVNSSGTGRTAAMAAAAAAVSGIFLFLSVETAYAMLADSFDHIAALERWTIDRGGNEEAPKALSCALFKSLSDLSDHFSLLSFPH